MHCVAYRKNLTTFLQHALADEPMWFTFSFSKRVSNLNAPLGDAWVLTGTADSKRKISNVFVSNDYYLSVINVAQLKGFPEYILY